MLKPLKSLGNLWGLLTFDKVVNIEVVLKDRSICPKGSIRGTETLQLDIDHKLSGDTFKFIGGIHETSGEEIPESIETKIITNGKELKVLSFLSDNSDLTGEWTVKKLGTRITRIIKLPGISAKKYDYHIVITKVFLKSV